ncbi:MAG: hypothetical protein QW051_04540 [Candidatus Aenigmatarchaeota archaeon]
MKTISRNVAVISAFLFLILTTFLSLFYFYNVYFSFTRKLEDKLSQTTIAYNKLKQLEQEAELLAETREKIANSPRFLIDTEMSNEALQELLGKILLNDVLEVDYIYLKAQVDYPILFEDTPVVYRVLIKTGGD